MLAVLAAMCLIDDLSENPPYFVHTLVVYPVNVGTASSSLLLQIGAAERRKIHTTQSKPDRRKRKRRGTATRRQSQPCQKISTLPD